MVIEGLDLRFKDRPAVIDERIAGILDRQVESSDQEGGHLFAGHVFRRAETSLSAPGRNPKFA